MTKKRKLNSKNPKYWEKSLLKEKTIKHLKQDKIELNGVVYKPYKVCELPPSFGEDILSWVNYKGFIYIVE